ncbi:MAG: hypothetical protein CVU05_01265 [Bacteroidetes bacterium HGW-Bacteroidetes-21]|jgi:hypothetical protein|nr:MAG: hypothetical protein CVU05_01265 [Bacteroidetes bacterium HGW-Bacteroidetes-21]
MTLYKKRHSTFFHPYKALKLLVPALMLLLFSCSDIRVFSDSPHEIISSQPWVIKHFVYAGNEQTQEMGCTLYSFYPDMSYHHTDCEGNLISDGIWQLHQDSSYLSIGPNTYKIVYLSKKIMTLRYGDVEICLLPVD